LAECGDVRSLSLGDEVRIPRGTRFGGVISISDLDPDTVAREAGVAKNEGRGYNNALFSTPTMEGSGK
jgi:hypothetical protein